MDVSLDKVLDAAKDINVGKNADSIMGMFEQVDKVVGHLDKILNFLNKAERSPLLGTLFRANMQKAGIDVKPLVETDPGIVPNSDLHKQILENINKMTPEQLSAMMTVLMEHDKLMEQKTLDGKTAGIAGDRTGRDGIEDKNIGEAKTNDGKKDVQSKSGTSPGKQSDTKKN